MAKLSVQIPLPASGEGPCVPPYTYVATAGKRVPVTTQAVPCQDVVKGAFPGPSIPSRAVGQEELGSVWAEMLTSA